MNLQAILGLLATAFSLYLTSQAELEAGQSVTTPAVQVGTIGGKPLYAGLVVSTTKASA